MFKNVLNHIRSHRVLLLLVTSTLVAASIYAYSKNNSEDTEFAYAVVNTIEKGYVSSGIHTTGEVVAAQKLDLDVYKQLARIDAVNIANGSHVSEGDVLISFDKSDVSAEAQSSRVVLAEAELALQNESENATDANTEIRSLQNKIATYKKAIADATLDIQDAYKEFLNANLEVVAHADDEVRLEGKTKPTLTGRYVGTTEGSYVIDVYGSNSDSGYSYRVSGLESYTGSVIAGTATPLGTKGLKITFPSTVRNGDTWVVQVPNITIATYAETKLDYERTVADLKETILSTTVTLANAEQDLEDLQSTDTSAYRNLTVEKAQASVSSAQEQLAQKYDDMDERDIVAPFAGTIQDMENVVVGATPTGGTEDTINLGTLISDEFLTTFTLSATDVAKVTLGQKVRVTITSFSEQPTFGAEITEISSLPESSGVAQYEVSAKINYNKETSAVQLREGVLADIEIVEEEKSDVVRIPVSALTYIDGKPTVQVIDSLTDTQKKEVERLGIIRTENTSSLPAYTKSITIGIYGSYYAEVTEGLSEGEYILTTATVSATEDSVVNEAGFGPGGGQRPPEASSGGSNTK